MNTNVDFNFQLLEEFFGGLLRCFNHSFLEVLGALWFTPPIQNIAWVVQLGRFKLVSKWLQHFKTQVGKTCFSFGIWQWRKKLLFSEMFFFEKWRKDQVPYTNHISNIHIFEPSCFPLVFYSSNCQSQWNKTAADCAWGGASDFF